MVLKQCHFGDDIKVVSCHMKQSNQCGLTAMSFEGRHCKQPMIMQK